MVDHHKAQMAGWKLEVLEVLDVLNVLEVLEDLEVLEVQIEAVVDGEEVSRRLGIPETWAGDPGLRAGSWQPSVGWAWTCQDWVNLFIYQAKGV